MITFQGTVFKYNSMTKHSEKLPKLFYLIFVLNFFTFASFNSLTLLPAHLSSVGASHGYIGFFMNVASLELVLFVVFFGKFSNKFNKKNFLLFGAVAYFVTTFSMFFFSENLILLMALRIISSIATVFAMTMPVNIVNDIVPKERRAGSIALLGISGIITPAIASYIGEKLILVLNSKYLFLQSGLFSFLSIIVILLMHEPHSEHRGKISKTFWAVIRNRHLYYLVIVAFVYGGGFAVVASFIPIFSKETLGVANISSFFIPFGIIALLIRFFFTRKLDETPKIISIFFALSSMIIAVCIILFMHSISNMAVAGLFYGIGHAIMFPVLSSLYVDLGNEEDKTIMFNTYVTFYTLGAVMLSTLLGFVGDFYGTYSIFLVTMVIISICLISGLIHKRKYIRHYISKRVSLF
jgi:predicted MFS family arabinose efflux permease